MTKLKGEKTIVKEKRKESMVDSIARKIKPIKKEVIDEAIELTSQVKDLSKLRDIHRKGYIKLDTNKDKCSTLVSSNADYSRGL